MSVLFKWASGGEVYLNAAVYSYSKFLWGRLVWSIENFTIKAE